MRGRDETYPNPYVRKNIPVNKEFALFQMAIDIVDLHIKSYYVLRVIPILIHYPDRGNMVILHAVRCATVYQVKIFPRLPQFAGSAGSAAQNRPIFSPVFFWGEAAGFGHAERQNGDFLEPKCGEL